jgi:hypothetical protein
MNDLLGRVHAQPGHLRQSLDLILVRTVQIGRFLVELLNPLVMDATSSSTILISLRYSGFNSWHTPSASCTCSCVARECPAS